MIVNYYIDTSVLLENTPLVKFIRNHIRDLSGVFSISSLVRISMLSEISRLSLRLYLNSLVYNRNIFWSSSKVFGNLRQSSVIFGNFRKMFGNVRGTFGHKFWRIFGNLRKVVGNLRKIVNYAFTRWREDMNFMFEWQEQYLKSERSERV